MHATHRAGARRSLSHAPYAAGRCVTQLGLELCQRTLSAGAPLLGLSYLITLANGFDRDLLLGHIGVLGVGLFAPAIAVKNGIQALPMAINQYISPRLSQSLGESGDPRKLWSLSWRATGATCLAMVP